MVKNPSANAGDIKDTGLIPGSGSSPGGGHGNPLHCSCLENPHEQRSLAGYSPWGYKESATTERLTLFTSFHFFNNALPKEHLYMFVCSWALNSSIVVVSLK